MKHTIKILMKLCATVWFMTSCTGSNPVDSSPDIGSWQLVGAGLPEGAGLSGLAFNSKDDIFAGFDWIGSGCDQCGGIFRSTDSGASWNRLSWGYRQVNPYVDALAVNSRNELFVYGGGLRRTSNSGNTWTMLDVPYDPPGPYGGDPIHQLAINTNDHIFAIRLNRGRVYRSTDNGTTWVLTKLGGAYSIAINSKNELFAARDDGFVLHSTNNGASRTERKVVNADVDFPLPKVAINSNDDIFVFVGTYSSSHSSLNMLFSFDNGKNWNKAPLSGLFTPVTAIAFNKNNDIFVGSNTGEIGTEEVNYSSVYRSNDNGRHWVNTGLTIHAGWFSSLAFDSKGNLFAGTHGNFDISRVFMLPAAIAN